MKVLLVFPPMWSPYSPYLSLPSLAAYLREKGVTVIQKDLNIEIYDRLLSKNYLLSLKQRIEDSFEQMDSRDQLTSRLEQQYYHDLYLARSTIEKVADEIDKAKQVLKDEQELFNIGKLHTARSLINQALAIVSSSIFPTMVSTSAFEIPSFDGSFGGIDMVTQDKRTNPFISLFEDYCLPEIESQQPDIVGISIAAGENQLIPALTLARLIKSRTNSHVVVGGHAVTVLANEIALEKRFFQNYFDSAIVFDGEKPLLELVRCIQHKNSLDNVPNLVYCKGSTVVSNRIVPPENLDVLPTPDFDGLHLGEYLNPSPVLPVVSSRGCYWQKCAFCTHSLGYGTSYQKRKSEIVAEDIQTLSNKYGVKHFAFCDECISPSSADELSELIEQKNLHLRFSANIRAEKQFTDCLCRKMRAAGFTLLYLGLESGCNRVLDKISKGTTSDLAIEVCRNLNRAGIWNHLYIMVGFPGESEKEAKQTVEFLTAHKAIIGSFHIDNFQLSKGSLVERYPENYGVAITTSSEHRFILTLDYTLLSGLSNSQAEKLKELYMEELISEYDIEAIMNIVDNYLPHYLEYYQNSDPYLKSIRKPLIATITNLERVTRNSIPGVEQTVKIDRLHYDITDVHQKICDNINQPIFPSDTCVLFDVSTRYLYSLHPSAISLLKLCNRKSNISVISKKIIARYGGELPEVEAMCVEFFQEMVSRGFVTV